MLECCIYEPCGCTKTLLEAYAWWLHSVWKQERSYVSLHETKPEFARVVQNQKLNVVKMFQARSDEENVIRVSTLSSDTFQANKEWETRPARKQHIDILIKANCSKNIGELKFSQWNTNAGWRSEKLEKISERQANNSITVWDLKTQSRERKTDKH